MSRCTCNNPKKDKNRNLSGCQDFRHLAAELADAKLMIESQKGLLSIHRDKEQRLEQELVELTAAYNKLCDEARWQEAELSALKQGVEVEGVIYHSHGHAGFTIHNLSRKKYKVGQIVAATVRLKDER